MTAFSKSMHRERCNAYNTVCSKESRIKKIQKMLGEDIEFITENSERAFSYQVVLNFLSQDEKQAHSLCNAVRSYYFARTKEELPKLREYWKQHPEVAYQAYKLLLQYR